MKIQLLHPITHDGIEYSRGIHEFKDSLARVFLADASHAAIPFDEGKGPTQGIATESADSKVTANGAISSMKADEVIELVDAEPSIEMLLSYQAGENQNPRGPRKSVIKAISDRIAELTDDPKE